jgi:hypothetical protein
MTKYGWFDFATPRPSLDSLLKSVREDGSGSPSAPSGGKEAPTRSEIISAQQNAVGGSRKRCVKGKACSATCIFAGDDCLVELDPEVGRAVNQARDFIQSAVQRGVITPEKGQEVFEKYTGLGKTDLEKEIGEEGKGGKKVVSKEVREVFQREGIKERAAELAQAFKELERDYPDPKERDAAIKRTVEGVLETAYGAKNRGAGVSEKEVEGIAANQKLIKDMTATYDGVKSGKIQSAEEMRESLKPVVEAYRPNKVTDGEVRLAMAMMPGEARTYLSKAGTVAEGGLFGSSPKGDVIPERYGPVQKAGKEDQMGRAFLITRIGLESGWKDVYTGQKVALLETDLEHMIPASVGVRWSEQGANYSLTKSRLNMGKSDGSPNYFQIGQKDGYFDVVASGKKSGKKEMIEFDSNNKLTPRGRELHQTREGALAGKKEYESQILSKTLDPRQAIAAIASSGLPSTDKTSLIGKVVATWVDKAPRTVAVGMQSAKPGTQSRAAQPWYWYGKDAAGVQFGNKLADKVADLQAAGDTKGLMKLSGIMRNIQNELLAINEREWGGQKIRNLTLGPQNPGAREAVTDMIKSARDRYLAEIEAL